MPTKLAGTLLGVAVVGLAGAELPELDSGSPPPHAVKQVMKVMLNAAEPNRFLDDIFRTLPSVATTLVEIHRKCRVGSQI
jgi:hypothetical protein